MKADSSATAAGEGASTENPDLEFPLTAGKALKHFIKHMTDYEKGEILDFKRIFFVGKGS